MNLDKLTPAPWEQCGNCWVRMPGDEFCPYHVEVRKRGDQETDAEFIALARNAFDVMMRRGWGVCTAIGPAGNRLSWLVCNVDGQILRGNGATDPFTALVEADRWFKENVEKA